MDGLEHWKLRDWFTGLDAASLAAGIDPFAGSQGWVPARTFIAVEMSHAYGRARGAFLRGLSPSDAPPHGEVWRWMAWQGVDLSTVLRSRLMLSVTHRAESFAKPADVLAAARDLERETFEGGAFTPCELARWFAANNFTPKFEFAAPVADLPDPPDQSTDKPSPSEKPLTTTERGTLLRLIAVLAAKGYGIDPKATRLDGIGSIVTDAQTLGVDMTDDTIRAKLREAFKLI